MRLNPTVDAVTERIATAAAPDATRLSRPRPRRRREEATARHACPAATSPTASPPAGRRTSRTLAGDDQGQHRHRLGLQRHAVGPPAAGDASPPLIKEAAREAGAVAQFAGGVPAMCDGVTQGQPGMELSLFSRDVIAMATAVALSHDMFDAALMLGVCDKIVPGLLIGALRFGHLPTIFVPGGPMTSGLPNAEKRRIRQLYAEGKVGRDELLEAEVASPTTAPAPAPSTAPPTPTRC